MPWHRIGRLTRVAAPLALVAGCFNLLSPVVADEGCHSAAAGIDSDSDPILSRPFAGSYPVTNYFDHEYPAPEEPGNGFQLTYCGTRVGNPVDGHTGFDWVMPIGTPIHAAAGGIVEFAGHEPPFPCGALGVVSGLVVQLRHVLGSRRHVLVYAHLDALQVQMGDSVSAGDVIASSGNTGCSTTPHLHFEVWRSDQGGPLVVTDPYGWSPADQDPWAAHPRGTASSWLWRPGQAP